MHTVELTWPHGGRTYKKRSKASSAMTLATLINSQTDRTGVTARYCGPPPANDTQPSFLARLLRKAA